MKMKSLVALTLAVFSFVTLAATSTPKGFTDNMDEALAQAKTSGKYIYACFSGSDWCGWCKKLEREVFSDKTFDFAAALEKDFVLVFIDSPRDKSLLSDHAKANNKKITKKYKIQGYPTALVLDSNGEQFAETGYRSGGAKSYVEFLMDIRKKGPEGVKAAEAAEKAVFGKFDEKFEGYGSKINETLRAGKDVALLIPGAQALLKEAEALTVPEAMTSKKDERVKMAQRMIAWLERRSAAQKRAAEKKASQKKSETK